MSSNDDIQWITMNGVHIPVRKGESKMAAVGRFIKGKRKAAKDKREEHLMDASEELAYKMEREHMRQNPNKNFRGQSDVITDMIETGRLQEDDGYWNKLGDERKDKSEYGRRLVAYMEKKYGKNYDKDINNDIKGYSTDPDRRVSRSRRESDRVRQKYWDKASDAEEIYKSHYFDRDGSYKAASEALKSQHPNRMRSDLAYERYTNAKELLRAEHNKRSSELEAAMYRARAAADENAALAADKILNAPSKKYKLKASKLRKRK